MKNNETILNLVVLFKLTILTLAVHIQEIKT